jgi:16S rRNA (guanine527-N7)-methyltransferase
VEKLINGARRLGLLLSPKQIESFEIYYHELISWNQKINLTAITDYEEVQVKHFLDSLSLTSVWEDNRVAKSCSVIDIGSGAGFPGLPLKIVFPELKLVLLESRAKKALFLQHLVERLNLAEVEISTARAEDAARASEVDFEKGHSKSKIRHFAERSNVPRDEKSLREKFDLVVSRAVAKFPTTVELALPFCCLGGYFVSSHQGEVEEEVASASKAINLLGGELVGIKPVDLPELEQRFLVIIKKISPTPPNYPRRSGIPKKRPLTG